MMRARRCAETERSKARGATVRSPLLIASEREMKGSITVRSGDGRGTAWALNTPCPAKAKPDTAVEAPTGAKTPAPAIATEARAVDAPISDVLAAPADDSAERAVAAPSGANDPAPTNEATAETSPPDDSALIGAEDTGPKLGI